MRVPSALVHAAEQPEQRDRVDALAVRDTVLAVGREGEVTVGKSPAGADLRGLLTEQARPQTELSLPLQGHCLGVDPTHHDEVAVETAVLLVGEIEPVVRVVDAFALRGQELNQLRAFGRLHRLECRCIDGTVAIDSGFGHAPLLSRPWCAGIAGARLGLPGRRRWPRPDSTWSPASAPMVADSRPGGPSAAG